MFFRPSGLHEGFFVVVAAPPLSCWGHLISDMNYVITAL